ncbi:MAG TPA: hypothetical protein DD454_01305 [Candidatus Moranbacteria bacterium]|nr:hypothetical protein [Candidatus Moranbacteria bacterium]
MLSAIGAGGYYAWKNNLFSTKGTPVDENEEIAPENETIPPEEEQITITPISEKYSSEKPNFLSINIETSSPEDIKRVISDTANELSGLQSKSPFEFIITDSNNNPIAFPIFSIASNLNLSSELLINLEEQFSFYIHNDQGGPRIVMAIEIKNGKEVSAEMLREEPTLLDTLSFLFLPEKPTTTKTTFQSSVYDGIDIRFVNFNADGSLSIDYTIYDNKLIIATSKSSMRSVIDKILQQKAAFSNTTPTEEVSTPAVIPPSPTTDIAVPDPMASIIPSESDTQKTTENALLPPSPAENSL